MTRDSKTLHHNLFVISSHSVLADPLEEAETIYAAAFKSKDLKEKDAKDKYPSFHQVDGQKKGTKAQLSSPKKQKKSGPKAQKPSPLDGIEEKIAKVCDVLQPF